MEFVKLHKNLKKKAQNYHKNQDLSIWAQQVLNLNTYNGPDDAHKARSTLNHTSLHYTYPFFPSRCTHIRMQGLEYQERGLGFAMNIL